MTENENYERFDRSGHRATARKKLEGVCAGRGRGYPGRHHADDSERDRDDGGGVWLGAGEYGTRAMRCTLHPTSVRRRIIEIDGDDNAMSMMGMLQENLGTYTSIDGSILAPSI